AATATEEATTAKPAPASNQAVVQFLTGHGNAGSIMEGLSQMAGTLSNAGAGQAPPLKAIPHIPGALEDIDAADIPQIKKYFELAILKLDDLLKREPDDVWSVVYRAH